MMSKAIKQEAPMEKREKNIFYGDWSEVLKEDKAKIASWRSVIIDTRNFR